MPTYNDPFDDLYGPQISTRPYPEEETDLRLKKIGQGILGGLGYVGDVLDKTFGGRAVRGLLSGKSREALSVLPLSDTLGLTSMDDRVSGKQLLQNAGLIGKTPSSDGFSMDDLLGIGAEIGLDPASYVGAAVPRLVFKGLNAGARIGGAGLEAATKVNPYTYAGRQVEKARTVGNALFDPSSGGAWKPPNQFVSQTVFTPEKQLGQSAAERSYFESLSPLDDIVKAGGDRSAMLRAMTQAGEGFVPEAVSSLQAGGYGAKDAATILDIATNRAAATRSGTLTAERAQGLLSKQYQDVPEWLSEWRSAAQQANEPVPLAGRQEALYAPRTLADVPADRLEMSRRQREALSGVSEFQMARDPLFHGLPGGTVGVNDVVRNPALGPARVSDQYVADELSKMLTGHPSGPAPPQFALSAGGNEAWQGAQKQVKDLSWKLQHYSDPVRTTGLFSEDLLGNLRARELESARTTASAKTILAGLHPDLGQIRPVRDLQAAGESFVRIPEFLDSAAMTHVEQGTPVAMEKVATMLGLPPTTAAQMRRDLAEFGIATDVANDMKRIGQAYRIPGALQPVVKKWDELMNSLKSNLTYPFPAFHFRNLMSGLFNMWRDNSLSSSAMKQMSEVQRGGSLTAESANSLFPGLSIPEATKAFRNELMANKVSFTRSGQTADRVGGGPASRGGFLPGELPTVGGDPNGMVESLRAGVERNIPAKGDIRSAMNPLDSESFLPTKVGVQAGNAVEDWIRGTHYLAKRLDGASVADAKLAVMKYQIDYHDLSEFERNVMKRVFPFYTFSRKNLPVILEDLAKRPAKLAGSIRASTSGQSDGFTPEWIGEGTSVNLGPSKEGFTRYLSSLGLPFEDEAVKALGNVLSGKGSRALQVLGGQTSPLLKAPAEEAFGVQLHTGRKLSDLRPNAAGQLAGDLPEWLGLGQAGPGVPQIVSELASATPASRAVTAFGKLTDSRKSAGAKALNLATGTTLTDVDVPKAQLIESREQVNDLLRKSPNVRHFEEMYVPKEKLGLLSPEELDAYLMFRSIEKRAKDAASQRKVQEHVFGF